MPLEQHALVLLDGQLVGMVVEANVHDGYIVQQPCDVNLAPAGKPQRRNGRVDIFYPGRDGFEGAACVWRDDVRAELGLPSEAMHHRDCPNTEKRT